MIKEQKCPNCGGAIQFDPKSGQVICPYCDSVFERKTEAVPEAAVSHRERDKAMLQMDPLPVYACRSCGAEVITPAGATGALSCPYCGNNIVLTQQFSGSLKPDGILPFTLMPDHLAQSVRQYYKGKKFLPKDFFSDNSIGPVTGVYVPFWIFDCDVSGTIRFSGEKKGRSYREGDYICTDYDAYNLDRTVSMSFRDMPLDASLRMENDLMDAILPYDLSRVVAFDPGYLAGFVADRFDESSAESQRRSNARMIQTGASVALQKTTGGFSSVSVSKNSLQVKLLKARYILLPVYLLNLKYKGEEYHFAVNGQTGKVEGKLPYSKKEERKYYWSRFLGGAAAMAAVIAAVVLL